MNIIEKKHYFECDGVKVHWGFRLLPRGFEAITLFDNVFDVRDKYSLKEYLNSFNGQVMVNHERIHILQAKTFETKFFGFYIFYIYFLIVNLFRYGFGENKAYYNVPFEKEAYDKELIFELKESNWVNYC